MDRIDFNIEQALISCTKGNKELTQVRPLWPGLNLGQKICREQVRPERHTMPVDDKLGFGAVFGYQSHG